MIAKEDFRAGRDIFEADPAPDEVLGHAAHITLSLVRKTGEGRAFGLCLDDTAQRAADEEGIVDRAGGRRKLAHSDAETRAAVYLPARLHEPTSLGQLSVNRHPCAIFGMKNVLPRNRAAYGSAASAC